MPDCDLKPRLLDLLLHFALLLGSFSVAIAAGALVESIFTPPGHLSRVVAALIAGTPSVFTFWYLRLRGDDAPPPGQRYVFGSEMLLLDVAAVYLSVFVLSRP